MSNIRFCLALVALSTLSHAAVLRGPYLQSGGPDRMTVRWRTDLSETAQVRFGVKADALGESATGAGAGMEQEVLIKGLQPSTRYYYSIGSPGKVEAAGEDQYFTTSPLPGSYRPVRLWVIGDSGTAGNGARETRDAYVEYAKDRPADLWLMLGDNAYVYGRDGQYQHAVFETYPKILKNTVLWSCLGNHETYNGEPVFPYFRIFSFPTQGEIGGVASGTENYFSFDYGDIHFVSLDAAVSSRLKGSPMLEWLEKDLAQNKRGWCVAFWHHPPYTRGSHNSDQEQELIEMRENVVPILEAHGVDLVLNGHSHSYERSFLLDGHYGKAKDFDKAKHVLDDGSRDFEGGALYTKPLGQAPHKGTLYVVNGSAAKMDWGSWDHPAMAKSIGYTLGSMVIDVDGPVLRAVFLGAKGGIKDRFTLVKGPVPTATPSPSATPYAGTPTATFTASPSPTITQTPTPEPTRGPVLVLNDFLDDAKNATHQNSLGYEMDDGNSANDVDYRHGQMNLSYAVTVGEAITWWYTESECLPASRYRYLNLELRGKDGGEQFDVVLGGSDASCKEKQEGKLMIEDQLKIGKTWKSVSIPLSAFKGYKGPVIKSVMFINFRSGREIQVRRIALQEAK